MPGNNESPDASNEGLLGKHDFPITRAYGLRQPENISQMRRQLKSLELAVTSHFSNQSPQCIGDSDREIQARLQPYIQAEKLVLEYGSLTEIQRLADEGRLLDANDTYVQLAIDCLKQDGEGCDDIARLKTAIKIEQRAAEDIDDDRIREQLAGFAQAAGTTLDEMGVRI